MSQFVISNNEKMGLRKLPLAFTEQGVAMLSSVLNSETAIAVNVRIIRIFTKMRQLLLTHKDILVKHEQEIQVIFETLKELINPPQESRPRIGFRRKDEQD